MWGRDAKIQWVKAWVEQHGAGHSYLGVGKAVFPDPAARGAALDGFAGLPGFATWTAQEAAEWIEASVTDLASAKVALARMARFMETAPGPLDNRKERNDVRKRINAQGFGTYRSLSYLSPEGTGW